MRDDYDFDAEHLRAGVWGRFAERIEQKQNQTLSAPAASDMNLPPGLDPKEFVSRLSYHLTSPGEGIGEYARRHKLELSKRLSGVRTVYLDTNYWIYLRDTYLAQSRGPVYDDLFSSLSTAASAGSIIFPISGYTWFELLRQTDPRTRLATARLIDKFSQGVGIENPDERMRIEILCFIRSMIDPTADLYQPQDLIWTKAAYILGNSDPVTSLLDP